MLHLYLGGPTAWRGRANAMPLDAQAVLEAAKPSAHELAVVASTTGPTNLLAQVLSPNPEALHQYLTRRLAYDAITSIETSPVVATLKSVAPR